MIGSHALAVLALGIAGAPPDLPDQSRLNELNEAAFRFLLTELRPTMQEMWQLPAAPALPWCLAVDSGKDPDPDVLVALDDLKLDLRSQSACEADGAVFNAPGGLAPPINLLALKPWRVITETQAEVDAQGFGGSGRLRAGRQKAKGEVKSKVRVSNPGGWVG